MKIILLEWQISYCVSLATKRTLVFYFMTTIFYKN